MRELYDGPNILTAGDALHTANDRTANDRIAEAAAHLLDAARRALRDGTAGHADSRAQAMQRAYAALSPGASLRKDAELCEQHDRGPALDIRRLLKAVREVR